MSLLIGITKNVGLVYIDMSGIARRALLRKVGKEYMKSQLEVWRGCSRSLDFANGLGWNT